MTLKKTYLSVIYLSTLNEKIQDFKSIFISDDFLEWFFMTQYYGFY